MTVFENNMTSQETLGAFFRDHEQTAIEMNKLLKNNRVEDSYPLVHGLKGAAGTLDLEPLYSLCQAFPRRPGTEDKDKLYAIIDALNATLRDIIRKLPASQAPNDEDEMTTFCRMLRQHNFKAIVMVRSWQQKPCPFSEQERIQLEHYLENFDFKRASEFVNARQVNQDSFSDNA